MTKEYADAAGASMIHTYPNEAEAFHVYPAADGLLGWIVYPGRHGDRWSYNSTSSGPQYYPTREDAVAALAVMCYTFPSQCEDFTVFPEDILPV